MVRGRQPPLIGRFIRVGFPRGASPLRNLLICLYLVCLLECLFGCSIRLSFFPFAVHPSASLCACPSEMHNMALAPSKRQQDKSYIRCLGISFLFWDVWSDLPKFFSKFGFFGLLILDSAQDFRWDPILVPKSNITFRRL